MLAPSRVTLAAGIGVTLIAAACSASQKSEKSETSKETPAKSSKVTLFDESFYVDHHSDLSGENSLMSGCPLWNAYWKTAQSKCTFARYQASTKENDDRLIYRSDDGAFEVNGEVIASDKVSHTAIKIDDVQYYCKTSAAALLNEDGTVRIREPNIFILTSQDAETFEELDAATVYGIAFQDGEACTSIFE